jgi:hypothetical protein
MFELLLSSGVIKMEGDEEHEEDAMFSKKPLGGFSCASCDKKLTTLSVKAGGFT